MTSAPLRDYQTDLIAAVRAEWARGARNVVMVLPTGGGKTRIFSRILAEEPGASCVIAHRQEIVSQISLALAREGVRHNLIAQPATAAVVATAHVEAFGRSWLDTASRVAVASVDTLIRRKDLGAWAERVGLWVCDEAHHLLVGNKWGTATALFPRARGLMPTATPRRADGAGLGRHADGVADAMVVGPPMRALIDAGWLADYRVVCAQSHIEEYLGDVAASGDWSTATLRSAAERSHIVGDVVAGYLRYGEQRTGITFATDVGTAGHLADAYRAAGVPAELLTGETDVLVRQRILRRLERGDLRQLVAVDVVSEGFDLPAIQVASFARPTASLAVWMQQAGRALRPKADGGKALLIDHVGNFLRHGPPDRPREWSLDRRERRKAAASDGIPLRVCLGCAAPYERHLSACPWCGVEAPAPDGRGSPEQVAGELALLDDATLAALRGDLATVAMTVDEFRARQIEQHAPHVAVLANTKRHAERLAALAELRGAMARWGGTRRDEGLSDVEMQRLFYLTFGVDVLTAQTLGTAEAEALKTRVEG